LQLSLDARRGLDAAMAPAEEADDVALTSVYHPMLQSALARACASGSLVAACRVLENIGKAHS
jgi:hypothetical protein